MNEAEYNRKIKGIERDIERAGAAIQTARDQRAEAWRRKDELRDEGWTE